MSKTLQRALKTKIPSVLQGSEWDSSDEEQDEPASNKIIFEKKQSNTEIKSKATKFSKSATKYDVKKGNGKDNGGEKDLVLYIGHLPQDFEEIDLRRFLSQFGNVYNCRVARKIETGKPKGYAFVRFSDEEVAQIACETLHGYFLEKKRLVCQLRPSHPGMFFDTDKLIDRRMKKLRMVTKQRNRNLSNSEKLKDITSRLVTSELKKRERLKSMGIDYDFPGYESNRIEFEEHFVAEEEGDDKDNDLSKQTESDEKKGKEKKKKDDSIDDTHSDGSIKKKKKRRKDSIDSIHIEGGTMKGKKKRTDSVDSRSSNPDQENEVVSNHERLSKSAKKKKKDSKKRRTSAP